MRLWDLLVIAAFVLVSWGAYEITAAAGFIVFGVAVAVVWWLFDEVKAGG